MNDRIKPRVQRVGGCAIYRPVDEIDLAESSTLREQLCGLVESAHIVVDLSRVTFLDCSGLGALVAASNSATSAGTSVHLAGAAGLVRRVLNLTMLDVHLDHHDDIVDAVESALLAEEIDATAAQLSP